MFLKLTKILMNKFLLLSIVLLSLSGCVFNTVNVDSLARRDRENVVRILGKLDPVITERRARRDLAALTIEELYAPLDAQEQAFLRRFEDLDVAQFNQSIPYQGISQVQPELVIITGQKINPSTGPEEIPPQFLPKPVYDAFVSMSSAMKAEIGKTVYVTSGYRSPAYQLYLFLFYLQNHDYSIRETARFVAWPGYSEHGNPERQAIDLVNEEGIDGQNNPAEFEALPEYHWLLKNAGKYGFELSYPKNSTMAFEPWHWRYKG